MLVKLHYYTTYLVSKIFSLVLIFSWKKWWKTNIRWKLWSHKKWSSIFKEKEGDHKKSLYFKKYRGTDDVLCRIRFKSLKTHLMTDIYNYMARMFHFLIWWMQCMLCVFLALWQKSCFKLVGSKSKFVYKVGKKIFIIRWQIFSIKT